MDLERCDLTEQVVDPNKSTPLVWMSLILRFGQSAWQAVKLVVKKDSVTFLFWDTLWTRRMTKHEGFGFEK